MTHVPYQTVTLRRLTLKPSSNVPKQSSRLGETLAALTPKQREEALRIAARLMARKAQEKKG